MLNEAFFNSATTLAGVGGVSHGLQYHAPTAACLLGRAEIVKKSIDESGHIDPSGYKNTKFMTLLSSMRHYERPTAYPKFVKYTDRNGYPCIPLSHKDHPKGVTEIEDMGIEIVWI